MLTVQQAIKNIDLVVTNVAMKRDDHIALVESIALISQRCELADELEKEKVEREKKT